MFTKILFTVSIFLIISCESAIDISIVYFKQGNELYDKQKFSEAIEKYTEAININSHDQNYYFNRGSAYYQIEKYEVEVDE